MKVAKGPLAGRKTSLDEATKKHIIAQCKRRLGENTIPSYAKYISDGFWKVWCRDSGYFRCVSVIVREPAA